MQAFLRIDLNLFMAVVCAIIYFSSLNMSEKKIAHNRIFRGLILAVFSLLVLESLSWILDGTKNKMLFTINYIRKLQLQVGHSW